MLQGLESLASQKKIEVILTTEAVLNDPIEAKGYQQFQVINLFLDTLVRKDPATGIGSGVAKSWDIDDSQSLYTFHLNESRRFHNGDVVDASDVLFSFNRHLQEKSPSVIASYLKKVVSEIKVLDPRTIQFKLLGPYPAFLELLTMPGYGLISKKSIGHDIIGSGPFVFKKGNSSHVCLEKFKDYLGPTTNIESFCFRIERDIQKTISSLNLGEVQLAMGSPLEVALSNQLKSNLVASPTFSMVTTQIFLNHSNPFFKKLQNRQLIRKIAQRIRLEEKILTRFDQPLDTYLPLGIMDDEYYKVKTLTPSEGNLQGIKNEPLRIVFPYGIFLESSVQRIAHAFSQAGFDVSYVNVKGKDLLSPILSGAYDLLFIPYQGVIPDPDGYFDLLEKGSLLKSAMLPTENFLNDIEKVRFNKVRKERLSKYSHLFREFENEAHVIPFSQNSIPIVHTKEILLPNLNFSFHLNLRELRLASE
jgi:peptide/nickel transport system substrate-binding protein